MALFHKVESGFITIGHHRVERKILFLRLDKKLRIFFATRKKNAQLRDFLFVVAISQSFRDNDQKITKQCLED